MPPLTDSIYFLPTRKCAEVYTHVVGAVEASSIPGFRTQMWRTIGNPFFMRQLINRTIEAELNKYE
jgi:hypothetical protein